MNLRRYLKVSKPAEKQQEEFTIHFAGYVVPSNQKIIENRIIYKQ